MKPIQADLHTHSIASGHAYATVTEMARAAADSGLAMLGLTEHTSGIPGTCGDLYFLNYKVLPRTMFGIDVLFGAEANILPDGQIDLAPPYLRCLDVCIAGFHDPCCPPGDIQQNTRAMVRAIENPCVDIISHPDDGNYPVDYARVVAAAARCGTLLEVNNNSLRAPWRKDVRENYRTMLALCREAGARVIVNSDAHFTTGIGNTDLAAPLLDSLGFPDELIANTDAAALKQYLRARRLAAGAPFAGVAPSDKGKE